MNVQPFLELLQQPNPEPITLTLRGIITAEQNRDLISSLFQFNLTHTSNLFFAHRVITWTQPPVFEDLINGDRKLWTCVAFFVGMLVISILVDNFSLSEELGAILLLTLYLFFISKWIDYREEAGAVVRLHIGRSPIRVLTQPKNTQYAEEQTWQDPTDLSDIPESEINTLRYIHLQGYAIKANRALKTILQRGSEPFGTEGRRYPSPLFNEHLSVQDQAIIEEEIRLIFGDIALEITRHPGNFPEKAAALIQLYNEDVYPLLSPEFDDEIAAFGWNRQNLA
jgi:hypothetical protein